MEPVFLIIAALTLVSGIAAMSLRNLVHCALCLVLTFAGLAIFYLHLGAEFVGFAQVLVYIGAVAILIVFALLLTRGAEAVTPTPRFSSAPVVGVLIALLLFGALAFCILSNPVSKRTMPAEPEATVRGIGELLMTTYVFPLEVIALLLTAALIGAVLIAMHEPAGADGRPEEQGRGTGILARSEASGDAGQKTIRTITV
jgi:NADH-quinone oxidoreductase subunit J